MGVDVLAVFITLAVDGEERAYSVRLSVPASWKAKPMSALLRASASIWHVWLLVFAAPLCELNQHHKNDCHEGHPPHARNLNFRGERLEPKLAATPLM